MDISKAFAKVWGEGLLYKLEFLGMSGKRLNLSRSFLDDRHQKVVFNGQFSDWPLILAGVLQGWKLGPWPFLIYINDLHDNLNSFIKLFADDTSLFSTEHDPNHSAKVLNDDLNKISEWAYKWKMLFNPDLTKQFQGVILSGKNFKTDHPIVYSNQAPVARFTCQKHLGMHLDQKLSFSHHVNEKVAKANKNIVTFHKLAHLLPRQSFITIYKSFVWPHLDYSDIVYDHPNTESFCSLIERVQYNAALTITGAIKGTS